LTSRGGKSALFIDGANLYATSRALGFKLDFKRLLAEYRGAGCLVRAYYYTAVAEEDEFASIKPLLDWLDYNGYTVVTKPTKAFVDASGRRKIKSNMDVELAVDAMEIARSVDQIILFSGDGSFCPLVAALQRRGVRVSVVSSLVCDPPIIASDLRRQADVFVDLQDIRGSIGTRQQTKPPGGV
jgi:uncharacterized LabA/DUF88 family protein